MSDCQEQIFKRCPACGVTKPKTAEFWSKRKRASDGIQVYCKICDAARKAAYRAVHRDEAKAYSAAYNVANRDEIAAQKAAYYIANRDKAIAYRVANREEIAAHKAAYRAAHRDKANAYFAAYRAANLDKVRASDAAYRAANPDKLKARDAAYSAAHPEARRAGSQRRRALKLSLPVLWTAADLQRALAYWGDRCAYCDCALSQLKLFGASGTHFDHYIPLADPRRPHPGTTVGNMLPTCAACNLAKNDADPVEWLTGKLGVRKAKMIIARVETYFVSLTNTTDTEL